MEIAMFKGSEGRLFEGAWVVYGDSIRQNVQRIQVVKGFRGDFTTTDNSQRVSFRVTKEPGSECC